MPGAKEVHRKIDCTEHTHTTADKKSEKGVREMNPFEWTIRSVTWLIANFFYEAAHVGSKLGDLVFWIFDKLGDVFGFVAHFGGNHPNFSPLKSYGDEDEDKDED
jgi:hypothetical protein